MTYSRPLTVNGRVPEPRDRCEIRGADRLHGRLPVDDRPRHLHHQRHRARRRDAAGPFPGAYVMEPKDREKQVFIAQPDAGPRLLARAGDRQEGASVYVRIDRKRKLPVTVLLRAMGYVEDEKIPRALRQLASTSATRSRRTPRRRSAEEGRPDRALQEAAPGRAAVGRRRPRPARAALLRSQALRPHAGRPLQAATRASTSTSTSTRGS